MPTSDVLSLRSVSYVKVDTHVCGGAMITLISMQPLPLLPREDLGPLGLRARVPLCSRVITLLTWSRFLGFLPGPQGFFA